MRNLQPDNTREDTILFDILYNMRVCDIVNYKREYLEEPKGVSNYLIVFKSITELEYFIKKNKQVIDFFFNGFNGTDRFRKIESKDGMHNIYFCLLLGNGEKYVNKFMSKDFTCIYLSNILGIDTFQKAMLKTRCRNSYGFPQVFKEF